MSKEIEIKVLNIDIDNVKEKLIKLDAKFQGDSIQKIYTYDLYPISTTYLSLISTIEKKIGIKETNLTIQKLISLLFDLSDLLSPEHKEELSILTNIPDFKIFINSISTTNIPVILFDKRFLNIIYCYNTNPNKWVRLRESKGKVKIALKQIYNRKTVDGVRQHSINDVKEIEIEIDNINKGKQLLEELGYYHKNYQEKRRISYILQNNVHVDIDIWPHIPPYFEVEAKDENTVYKVLTDLGFKKEDAKILNADDVFTFYGLDMYSYKELKF